VEALQGIGLVLRTPRLRGLAFWPIAVTLVLYVALTVFGASFAIDFLMRNLPIDRGGIGEDLLRLIAWAVWFLLSPLLFTTIVSVFYGVLFETLSRAVEETVAPGEPLPSHRPPILTQIQDTVGRLFFNGLITLVALALSLFLALGPVPWVLAAGLMGVLDFSASAFGRRGILLGGQFRALFAQTRLTLPFVLVAGLFIMLPFVGVFFLPGLAAGATLLTRRISAASANG
jgi:uncharacterized protein involved in cysteine biosynthesis